MAKRSKLRTDTLTDLTRDAIANSGLSLYALAEATGIDRGQLWRFANGKQSITLDTFDRLNEVLRLRITRR